ncbi:unnamed protein product [Prunus brigantina]
MELTVLMELTDHEWGWEFLGNVQFTGETLPNFQQKSY